MQNITRKSLIVSSSCYNNNILQYWYVRAKFTVYLRFARMCAWDKYDKWVAGVAGELLSNAY